MTFPGFSPGGHSTNLLPQRQQIQVQFISIQVHVQFTAPLEPQKLRATPGTLWAFPASRKIFDRNNSITAPSPARLAVCPFRKLVHCWWRLKSSLYHEPASQALRGPATNEAGHICPIPCRSGAAFSARGRTTQSRSFEQLLYKFI